jgi:hypothetical protein
MKTENQKLGSEPAFSGLSQMNSSGYISEENVGMSKRFYAACAAMQGMLANNEMLILAAKKATLAKMDWMEIVAEHSFEMADQLLKADIE